jgi:hypothetical protein
VALVKVDRALKSPVFIAAMRLRDVASEVASTLKQFPASFELTDCELVVYTWREDGFEKSLLSYSQCRRGRSS